MHINVGLIKNLLSIEEDCFKCLIPNLSFEKIKACMFYDQQIGQLVKDEHFIETITELQTNAWLPFKSIDKYFLGNTCVQNYTEIVQELLER